MRVSDFTIRIDELRTSASLRQAALHMHKHGVDCLPVADGDHRFVGLLTADAVALATAADRRDPGRTRAHRVMVTDCCHCYADEEVEVVLRSMTQRRARRSVVLDRDEHPIGIVALGDLPMRRGHASSIEAIMDCDELERRWIDAARKALGRPAPAFAGRAPAGRAMRQPARAFVVEPAPRTAERAMPDADTEAAPGRVLPLDTVVEAYLDYYG